MSEIVEIFPKHVFGLRTNVKGNVQFTSDQIIIYPAAGVLVVEDFVANTQRYLRTLVNVYDSETLKKLKSLKLSSDFVTKSVGNLCFTNDSKGIAVLSKEPDAFLTIYNFDKNDSVVTERVSTIKYPGRATLIHCNPSDISVVAVGGANMLKVMSKTGKSLVQVAAIKGDDIIMTSLAWLNGEIIVAGSNDMKLYFAESGELRGKYDISDLEFIDLEDPQDSDESDSDSCVDVSSTKKIFPIKCVTNFPTGFSFTTNNCCHVFRRLSPYKFRKVTLLVIPVTTYDEELYVIKNISINDQQDKIIAATEHSQIYFGKLFDGDSLGLTRINFEIFSEPLHIDSIIDLSVCCWKSIVMTASKDRTVRIWNYNTMKVELLKKFLIEIFVISLHPSGMFAAIGFTNALHLVQIQLKDLKTTKSFKFQMCSVLKFSNQGHLLAVGCEKVVAIISVFTFETLMILKGHIGILSLEWSKDDRFLVSSGKEGSVYEWDISNGGQRVNELIQKGTLFNSIAVSSSDQNHILAVTQSSQLCEITQSQMVHEFKAPKDNSPLTSLVVSQSRQVLFTANDDGNLYNVSLPLSESRVELFINNRFHRKSITRLSMSYDENMLISAEDDGTLVFWIIRDNKRTSTDISLDSDIGNCEDVLISRRELYEKNNLITLLETLINNQKPPDDIFQSEKMQEIHQNYCNAIEGLKEQNEILKAVHNEQLNELSKTKEKTDQEHEKMVEDLEFQFNERIIQEHEVRENLTQQMEDLKMETEEKLRKSSNCLHETIDERNIVNIKSDYEKRLKECDENYNEWRGNAGILKQENIILSRDSNELKKENELLKEQKTHLKEVVKSTQRKFDDMKRDLDERDEEIRVKEEEMMEMNKRIIELEKYKEFLTYKTEDLRKVIETREAEIQLRKETIIELQRDLDVYQREKVENELKMSELNDKLLGKTKDFNSEQVKSNATYDRLKKVYLDIHNLTTAIHCSPQKMKESVKSFLQRYGGEYDLNKMVANDIDVQNEFARQRNYYENLLKRKSAELKAKKCDETKYEKLLKDNVSMMSELNRLKKELDVNKKENIQWKSIIGLSKVHPSVAREKFKEATREKEEIHADYQEIIKKFKDKIKSLNLENESLKLKISE
ncbi:CLUMA_CG019108, isoform A [Clunio marinus]|uniref:CLUMA_CG019108, isoform A n=1 Tax=Clunio marinus TaxID=568069 RepID=A0A1J1J1P0_9DIPT|nr:CLUMA_CG019108, isoform A [Clunio marinus]